jgi:Protein of unknown function (DUF5672)
VLVLPDVTLISLAARNHEGTVAALMKSQEHIQFAAAKLVSPTCDVDLPGYIVWEQCKPLRLRGPEVDDYSRYCIYDLWRHVDTDYALVVQADGYVINPHLWQEAFLDYDYIGAPWPISKTAYIDPFGHSQRVGNGGFSLRSRKLLTVPQRREVTWDVNSDDFYNHMGAGLLHEDGNICVHNKHVYEQDGCRFAPVELAVHFSQEHPVPEARGVEPFGFHRYRPQKASSRGRVLRLGSFLRSNSQP